MRRFAACTLLPGSQSAFGADGLPTDDTLITAANAAGNSGGQTAPALGAGATGLVQFSLAALPAGTLPSGIQKASLLVYGNRVTVAGNVPAAAFAELSATYSNANTSVGSTFAGPIVIGTAQAGTKLNTTTSHPAHLLKTLAPNGSLAHGSLRTGGFAEVCFQDVPRCDEHDSLCPA